MHIFKWPGLPQFWDYQLPTNIWLKMEVIWLQDPSTGPSFGTAFIMKKWGNPLFHQSSEISTNFLVSMTQISWTSSFPQRKRCIGHSTTQWENCVHVNRMIQNVLHYSHFRWSALFCMKLELLVVSARKSKRRRFWLKKVANLYTNGEDKPIH